MQRSPLLSRRPVKNYGKHIIVRRRTTTDILYRKCKCYCHLTHDNIEISDDEFEESCEPNKSQNESSTEKNLKLYYECQRCFNAVALSDVKANSSQYLVIDQGDRTHEKCFVTNKEKNSHKKSNTGIYLTAVLSLGFIGTTLLVVSPSSIMFENEQKMCVDIFYLQEQNPSQTIETFKNIETIINDVLKTEPIHPAVFLFIHKYENPKFANFINDIAKFASCKLGVSEPHIVLKEKDYINPQVHRDFGYLIENHKHDLDKKKVMVVHNLHNMPGRTAQALHSFCDEFTPLVDRAVYILTLKVDSLDGTEIHIAEKMLNSIWSDLDKDILEPLITRVTSTVIKFY